MRKRLSSLPASPDRRRRLLSVISGLPVFCAAVFLTGIASAQAPTEEQRDAIRAECRSDFIAKCSGVTPGGIEALTCLQQHSATLSAGCRKAVSAVDVKTKSTSAEPTPAAPANTAATTPAPATATPAPATGTPAHQPTQAQRNAVKSACQRDFMAQCSGVTPGGSAALSCLQQHNAALSAPCQQAVAALGGSAAPATGNAAATGAITPAPPATMPAFSPREEVMILRETCGADFRALCRMVPLGGGRGIACLRDNLQRVSPACHRVLTSGL
ncbi:hypothetical protein RHEC894_CH03887 [Rhizobium sp. CIAT894]|uniref:hypothetical protein n=1 Tax=Rhizobium sp. CIAT894 TaxID=2020312 RepID=UPI000A1E545A|nr:hypothetical protein [Rhizobium sp. CIAT894]ARM90140.1 hypothetical protein RHEC894_CH03887 [Rhizobium sp. CIAT894]